MKQPPFRPLGRTPQRPCYQQQTIGGRSPDVSKLKESTAGKAVLYLFSLKPPYLWTTSLIVVFLFLLYLFLDLFLKSSDWPPLVPTLFLYPWVWGIWILFLIRVFGKVQETNEQVLLLDLFIIYVFTLFQYTSKYAMVAKLDKHAFVVIPPDSSPITRIGLCLFLSVETMAALGTGAIFANNESPWGFIVIGIQSTQNVMFITLVVGKVLAMLLQRK